jgi:hypothetical protein
MQNCKTLRQPLLGELAVSRKREERKKEREKEKMPFIVATYIYASSQAQRMHSAPTNLMVIDHKWMHKSYKTIFIKKIHLI